MRSDKRSRLTATAVAALATLTSQGAAAAELPKLAVMKIDAKRGVDAAVAEVGEEYLAARITETRAFEVISRDDVRRLLEHAGQLELMVCDTESCAAEVGGALGVDLLLNGTVSRIDDTAMITLKLIWVSEAKVERREAVEAMVVDDKVDAAVMRALKQAGDRMFAAELEAAGVEPDLSEETGTGGAATTGGEGGKLWTWIAAGSAALALAAGGGLLLWGNLEMLEAQALADQSKTEAVRYQDFAEQRDRATLGQIAGLSAIGVGALAAGGAAALFFVEAE
jgi:TolB-like protein